MGTQLIKLLLKLILIMILSRMTAAQALPGCQDKCGNVTIPYPFGITEGCYLSKFYHVNCETLQIHNTSFQLLNIDTDSGYLYGLLPVAYNCSHKHNYTNPGDLVIKLSRFPISSTQNLLTTVGCDARANMKVIHSEDYITGCLSMTGCNMLTNGSCLGMGCSQVPVPAFRLTNFRIHTQRNTVSTVVKWIYNKCTYGFIVEKDGYKFLETDLDNMQNRTFRVSFEWSVANTTCEEAQRNATNYLCKENSECLDTSIESNRSYPGYRCKCPYGYSGNPYLGCQDINECVTLNNCMHGCVNTMGSYKCTCPWGQHGDGRKNGTRCYYSTGSVLAGTSMSTTASIVLTLILYAVIKQRQIKKNREKFFKKNGGLILQKLLFESKQSSQLAKIFAAGLLEKATNNFHKTNVIGQGGCGVVYKGTLADKTMVAIKKSKSVDESHIEQFINEVINLSKISHPNVVKLLGCCLETPTPLLVYEFITNKTVFQHLHEHDFLSSLSFERRLNIATQTAEALAHIHTTKQIIHRDIKSSNILLTDDYTAKVSDFGISTFIPVDQTHLQTLVHGTLGYIDPEYFRSGILTEKSDVYSFGMVLVELLTGKKVFSHDGTESELGLAIYFVSSLERGLLIQILDDAVKKDGFGERIQTMARLAKECVELEGMNRPNMQAVKERLKNLSQSYLKGYIIHKKVKYIDEEELILFE